MLLGTLDPLVARTVEVEADFGDVHGIQPGDPVFLFGVKTGKVRSVTLLPPHPRNAAVVRVAIALPEKHHPYLRVDSIARVDKTLTGNISILIQEGQGRRLRENERLRGQVSVDLAAITERVQRVLDEGEATISAFRRILNELERNESVSGAVTAVSDLAGSLRDEVSPLSTKFEAVVELLRAVVEENRSDVRRTVANLTESTDRVRGVLEKLEGVPADLDRSLKSLENVTAAAADLLRDNRTNLDVILEDLRKASTDAANLTAEVKRRPWRLLYRPSDAELESIELYDAAWAYNLGATELNRTVRDLTELIKRQPGALDESDQIPQLYERIRASLERQGKAEHLFWERLRATN